MTYSNNLQKQKTKIILGIDLGTSGLRACIVQKTFTDHKLLHEKIIAEHAVSIPSSVKNSNTNTITQSPALWIDGLNLLLSNLKQQTELSAVTHLILDATSSTVLLLNPKNNTCTEALMYNDTHAVKQAIRIDHALELAKQSNSIHLKQNQNGAHGASSTLAKVMSLLEASPKNKNMVICHQIDYLNYYLCGALNITDENNALKLGYDLINQAWPDWVADLLAETNPNIQLPKVVKPGQFLKNINPNIAESFGFHPKLKVMAGTTDSIAGFLASGAKQPGDAVTSLGSTIAIKAISNRPIFDSNTGLYSHRLGNYWLVGGASNSGGQVLRHFYSIEQLKLLNHKITNEDIQAFLNMKPEAFYPLITPGERFPILDTQHPPKLPPLPKCTAIEINQSMPCLQAHKLFLLQLLNGMAHIEALCYQALSKMSETDEIMVKNVYAVGGGTLSHVWMKLREHQLPATLCNSIHNQAAYGVTQIID